MNKVLGAALLLIAYFMLFDQHTNYEEKRIHTPAIEQVYEYPIIKPPLDVFIAQDVSRSIKKHGVIILTAGDLQRYYESTNRDIRLRVGLIGISSNTPPISIELHSFNLPKPVVPNFDNASYTSVKEVKATYLKVLQKYKVDSLEYMERRQRDIVQFCIRVENALQPFRNVLVNGSDILSSFEVADRSLAGYWHVPCDNRFILAITDGIDSRHHKCHPLHSRAQVILINADKQSPTDIDSVLTQRVVLIQDAIQKTLN